jgi:hypothetical protein
VKDLAKQPENFKTHSQTYVGADGDPPAPSKFNQVKSTVILLVLERKRSEGSL